MWPPALRPAREAVAVQVDCFVAPSDVILVGFLGAGAVQHRALAQSAAHMGVECLKWVEAEHRRKIRNHVLGPEVERWYLGAVVALVLATAHRQTAAHLCWTVEAVAIVMVRTSSFHL